MAAPAFDLSSCATGREILAQPAIWRAWAPVIARGAPELRNWIAGSGAQQIWLSGAGTSAFVGDLVAAAIPEFRGMAVRSVPSTDLVAMPAHHLRPGLRPLVISFGRSGNSAESLGALDALDAIAPDAPRLNITCNRDSALARRTAPGGNGRVIVLPEATHDTGFAMTSSYSTMLLSALSVLDETAGPDRMTQLAETAEDLLARLAGWAAAQGVPGRVVFLGSGAQMFAAREAALKLLELTAGATVTLWDSFLGFRHGPKSFVDDTTRIIAFTAADRQAQRYEADLLAELSQQFPEVPVTTIGPTPKADFALPPGVPDAWNAPLQVMLAQVLAVRLSQALGLNVDDPFAGRGTLTRVVSGVTLYPPEVG